MQQAAKELESLRNKPDGRFPTACRQIVRSLPGNGFCVDCQSPNPDWASVSHGCLICLQCSGRHRSYGVQTSTVRSIDMDNWTYKQVLAMLEGGNLQLQVFFDRNGLGNASGAIGRRYSTKIAEFYRTNLAKHVLKVSKTGSYKGREVSRQRYTRRNSVTACSYRVQQEYSCYRQQTQFAVQ